MQVLLKYCYLWMESSRWENWNHLFCRKVSFLTWVSLVEQELLTLPEHLSSPPVFSGIRVTRSLVLYVCFVDRCLSFCTFSFGHCVVCSSSIHGFWLPLWYLQTLFNLFMCWVAWNVSHWMLCDKQSNQIYLFTRITYPSKWWVQDWL
jgi:hypothetical protein